MEILRPRMMRFSDEIGLAGLRRRYLMSVLLGVVALVVIVARLYFLQVLEGERHRQLSLANFIDVRRQVPLRGLIFDSNHRLLADNRPSFNVYLIPAFCPKTELADVLQKLASLLGLSRLDADGLSDAYHAANGLERWVPILVRRDIAWEELAALEQQLDKLAGVEVRPETRRFYPQGELAAHLIGYVGEIGSAELERLKHKGYRRGDFIGKYGIEQAFEQQLRGRPGTVMVVVDSKKQPVPRTVVEQLFEHLPATQPARPGNNLVLSIDARLQRRAEQRFPGFEGAVVALDPRTGFVLALVSKPAFDPNLLSRGISARRWKELVTDPYKPLTNRATQQHYPPGSTFKPFTALAALDKGVIDEKTKLTCTGAFVFGGRAFRCWRAGGHGKVDLHRAIVQSCDVFFYRAGHMAGQDAIADVARRFGFGSVAHLDCGPEVPGIVPDTEWYRKHTKTGYLPGFVLSNAIGQGDVNVTPLQLALAYAAIANGGTLYKPQVVLRIERPDGEVVKSFSPVKRGDVGVNAAHLEAVRRGLVGVVNEPGGTAWWRRPRNVTFEVAGKTGTAQVVVQGQDRGKDLPYDLKDHAWFVGWAPVDDPRIVVAVVNEHGGHGSSGAAPLVMELISYYLESLAGLHEGESP